MEGAHVWARDAGPEAIGSEMECFPSPLAGLVCDFATNCHEYEEVNQLSIIFG